MPEILTTSFKTDTTRKFVADGTSNEYYVFVSSIDAEVPSNSISAENTFLSNTLFGKKIQNNDTRFMIRYYPWQNGETYVQYDDIVDLEDEKFYAAVGPTNNDTGDYRLYKCLFNNYGGEVSSPPIWDATTVDQIYRTADNYVWKFMYEISPIEFEAYNALGYIPVTTAFDVDPAYTTGGSPISDIFLENKDANFGYAFKNSNLGASPFSDGTLTTVVDFGFQPVQNYYSGQTAYLRNPSGLSFLYEIDSYSYSGVTNRAVIRVKDNDPLNAGAGLPHLDGVTSNAALTILPRVEILGDGTGATAIPIINNDGRITDIQLLTSGDGYNIVNARVVDPLYDFTPDDPTSTDVRSQIRPILAPKDGHGFNLLDELKCKHFLLYGYVTGANNEEIGASNTYSNVGIVREPTFTVASPDIFDNRIRVTSAATNLVTVNSVITQVNANNEVTFKGIVHEVDLLNEQFYIAEYAGPYSNQPGQDNSLDLTKGFLNETGQIVEINSPIVDNVLLPVYTQRTGKVYYMENFFPLSRNDLSREEFKIVFEF